MKQGRFKAVRLVVFLFLMLSITVFSISADDSTVNLQTIVLEAFDGETTREWSVGGRTFTYEFEWRADASRFASEVDGMVFPQLSFVQAWPMALFGANRENRDIRSFGIWGRFDRRGYNWVDIYPVAFGTEDPFEIPIPGRIQNFDMWVWGSNLNYTMEIVVRDHQGITHTIPMGSLAFEGWRNMRVRVPSNIPQTRRVLPRFAGLHFVKFRIWTTPMERVDNFFIYFSQLQILTDVFEALFDGNDLADPARVQELWGQSESQTQ